jgi:hypothetical protein
MVNGFVRLLNRNFVLYKFLNRALNLCLGTFFEFVFTV